MTTVCSFNKNNDSLSDKTQIITDKIKLPRDAYMDAISKLSDAIEKHQFAQTHEIMKASMSAPIIVQTTISEPAPISDTIKVSTPTTRPNLFRLINDNQYELIRSEVTRAKNMFEFAYENNALTPFLDCENPVDEILNQVEIPVDRNIPNSEYILSSIKTHLRPYFELRMKSYFEKNNSVFSDPKINNPEIIENKNNNNITEKLDNINPTNNFDYKLKRMELMEEALTASHTDVADAIKFIYYNSMEGDHEGFTFIENLDDEKKYRWNKETKLWGIENITKQGDHPMVLYFDDLKKSYENTLVTLRRQLREINDDTQKSTCELTIRKIHSLISKLSSIPFKNAVWKELSLKAQMHMDQYKDPITRIIPMNDGNNINIFTNEIIPRIFDGTTGSIKYTKSINAAFDPSITTIEPNENSSKAHKEAYQFFMEIMYEEVHLVKWLIIMLGVYISGDLADKSFLIFLGEGYNGKTFIEKVLTKILGSFYTTMMPGVIYDSGVKVAGNSHNTELKALKGARLATCSEAAEGHKWHKNNIKRLTGNDSIAVRGAHQSEQENLTFPCHLIIFANNKDIPTFDINDPALKGRVKVVPMLTFFYTESPDEKEFENPIKKYYKANKNQDDRLSNQDYLNAIFTMFCLGAKIYYDNDKSYPDPEEIKEATNALFKDDFEYHDFIEDCCEVPQKGQLITSVTEYQVKASEAYQVYKDYTGSGFDSLNMFSRKMRAKFPKSTHSNGMQFRPIRLKPENQRKMPNGTLMCMPCDEPVSSIPVMNQKEMARLAAENARISAEAREEARKREIYIKTQPISGPTGQSINPQNMADVANIQKFS
jgi:hypothetical protein